MKLDIFGIGLLVIAVLAYFIVNKLLNLQLNTKRKRLSSFLQEHDIKENSRFVELLKRKGILQYISPSYIIEESEKHGTEISKSSFYSTFLIGTVLGVIVMIIYFRPLLFLMPIAILGGVIATNLRLHKIKKEYIHLMDSKISIYMSSVATAMMTFSNMRDVLVSVIPSTEEPIRNDLEKVLLQLQDGKNLRIAFEKMNIKYPHKELRLFHDQLDVVIKSGTSDKEVLRNIALKMKKKETYRRRLKTAHRQQFKVWRTFVFLSLSTPFLFIMISMDNYLLVMNHLALSIVFAFTFLMIFFIYRKLEQLELYDPTTDDTINYS